MAESRDINLTQVASDIFSEFLEVSIHSILYNRGLYPAGVFEKRKKYNVPVQMCLHPEVTQYVSSVVDSVKVMVQTGQVDLVTMVILDNKKQPLERFVFEIDNTSKTGQSEDKFLFTLEESLRAFLLKLNVCDALLKPLPADCSWVVNVHTKESTADRLMDTNRDFAWVEAEEKQVQLQDPSMLPLKTMHNNLLKMQLYVEESGQKDGNG